MRAMILAAGRGTRMGDLTQEIPKALLKLGKLTLIENRITQLAKAGVTEIIINLYGLAKQIPSVLGSGERFGVRLIYSIEEEIIETAGGIIQALHLFNNQPFIVCSCDTITDYDFSSLVNHRLENSLAHLVLTNNPSHHPQGDYAITETGLLTIKDEPKFNYAGFGLLHPNLFEGYPRGYRKIAGVFEAAIDRQLISGELHQGLWLNVDTPERFEEAKKLLA